jgi:hypothetical protein
MCVTGMLVMFHFQSWKLLHREIASVLQSIAMDLSKRTLLAVLSTGQLLILVS